MTDQLTPDRAARLLRAKAAELEAQVLRENEANTDPYAHPRDMRIAYLAADIALVAQLLADHIERSDASRVLYEAHTENLIERVYALEGGDDADDLPMVAEQRIETCGPGCRWGHTHMAPCALAHPYVDDRSEPQIDKPEVW